jgi:xanthine/CO dehydrogenase XdhC/CoxF family maturation factor
MKKIAEAALRLLKDGGSFAMATILESSGSIPREPGAV